MLQPNRGKARQMPAAGESYRQAWAWFAGAAERRRTTGRTVLNRPTYPHGGRDCRRPAGPVLAVGIVLAIKFGTAPEAVPLAAVMPPGSAGAPAERRR